MKGPHIFQRLRELINKTEQFANKLQTGFKTDWVEAVQDFNWSTLERKGRGRRWLGWRLGAAAGGEKLLLTGEEEEEEKR